MPQEQPLVLVLLTGILRTINLIFVAVVFPLHWFLIRVAAPCLVHGAAPTIRAGLARGAAAVGLITISGAYIGAGVMAVRLLGYLDAMIAVASALTAVFAVMYGVAISEKGMRLDRPWRLPLQQILSGMLEVVVDLMACVGAMLVAIGAIRILGRMAALVVRPIQRVNLAGTTSLQPALDEPMMTPRPTPRTTPRPSPRPTPQSAGPEMILPALTHPASAETVSWRQKVRHELIFTVVDWLCALPLLLLVLMSWRVRHSFKQIWSHTTEASRRLELVVQCALATSDLPFIVVLGLPVLLSGYRAPALARNLFAAEPPRYKEILTEAALALAIDLPFLLAGAFVLASWRMPLLLRSVCSSKRRTAGDRRLAVLAQFMLLLLDLPTLLCLAIVGIGSCFAGILVFVLAPLARTSKSVWSADGWYRLGELRRAIRRRPRPSEDAAGVPESGANGEGDQTCACPGVLADSARHLRSSAWRHTCVLQQAALLLMVDLPLFLVVGLPVLSTGWRALDLIDLIMDPPPAKPNLVDSSPTARGSTRRLSSQRHQGAPRSARSPSPLSRLGPFSSPIPAKAEAALRNSTNAMRFKAIAELFNLFIDLPYVLFFLVALLLPWRAATAISIVRTHRKADARRQPLCLLIYLLGTDLGVIVFWLLPLGGLAVSGYLYLARVLSLHEGLGAAIAYGMALLVVSIRCVRAVIESCNQEHDEWERHVGAMHELLLLLLDVPYLLGSALLLLTVYRMPFIRAQRREGAALQNPLSRRYQSGLLLSHRLRDHELIIGGALGTFIDAGFLVVALPALCSPWRCRLLISDAFSQRTDSEPSDLEPRSDWWTPRWRGLKHAALVPLDILSFLLGAFTALLGPWRLPLRELRRLPAHSNVFVPNACLIKHSPQDEVRGQVRLGLCFREAIIH